MKIAITGHRPNKLGNDYDLKSSLISKIEIKIENILFTYPKEILILITGMALGIDTLFAKIAIEHKIPFIAAIPLKGQENVWPKKSQDTYFDILSKAKEIQICDTGINCDYEFYKIAPKTVGYSSYLMQKRNEWMVDSCDILIAVWDRSAGGTANCINYAVSKNKEIIYVNPKTL